MSTIKATFVLGFAVLVFVVASAVVNPAPDAIQHARVQNQIERMELLQTVGNVAIVGGTAILLIALAIGLRFLWALLASAIAGIVAYSAVFLLASLLVSRALLVGIVYALVWESLLGRYLAGLKIVSIRHYTESILVGLADDPGIALKGANGVVSSIIVIAAVTVLMVLISTWRLRNLDLE